MLVGPELIDVAMAGLCDAPHLFRLAGRRHERGEVARRRERIAVAVNEKNRPGWSEGWARGGG